LRFDGGLSEFYRVLDRNDFFEMGVKRKYLSLLNGLDDIHSDPFDRLLIATALAENITIVTADENIHRYKARWLW